MENTAQAHGFTLVEILVVMVVIGLIAGVAMPNMHKMIQSTERAGQRDSLLSEIAGLSYQTYLSGRSFTLSGAPVAEGQDASLLHVPQGWRLEVPRPITYNFNGLCSGGEIILIGPDGQRESLQLEAPTCRVRAESLQ